MELSYSVQFRARARMPKAICDRETPEENLTLSLYVSKVLLITCLLLEIKKCFEY